MKILLLKCPILQICLSTREASPSTEFIVAASTYKKVRVVRHLTDPQTVLKFDRYIGLSMFVCGRPLTSGFLLERADLSTVGSRFVYGRRYTYFGRLA